MKIIHHRMMSSTNARISLFGNRNERITENTGIGKILPRQVVKRQKGDSQHNLSIHTIRKKQYPTYKDADLI